MTLAWRNPQPGLIDIARSIQNTCLLQNYEQGNIGKLCIFITNTITSNNKHHDSILNYTYPSLPSFVHHGKCTMPNYVLFGEFIFTNLDDFHFHQFSFNHRHFQFFNYIHLISRTKRSIL